MYSVGWVGATLSPGCICMKSPKTAASCQTPSFNCPSMMGGAERRGMRTGSFLLTYRDGFSPAAVGRVSEVPRVVGEPFGTCGASGSLFPLSGVGEGETD